MRRFFSSFFLGLSLFLFAFLGYLILLRHDPQRLSFNVEDGSGVFAYESESQKEGMTIEIASLDISLGIYPANIKSGKWEASSLGVSHLSTTPLPGEIGNSVLYGHNWPGILGKLTNIKTGDEILVKNSNDKKFIVSVIQVVDPSDTSILNNTTDTRITLYTCTGLLDSKRFVVSAILED